MTAQGLLWRPSKLVAFGAQGLLWRPSKLVAFGALLGVLALGCGEDEPAPVQVARRFVHVVQVGQVEGVLEMVDAAAVAHVEQAAERASDQVGGRRSVERQEMLQVVDVDPYFQVKKGELVQGDDQRAIVRLTGADETSRTLELVYENGSWRVHLPLPRAPMAEMVEP
jgi:hypothetical protein